MEIFRSGRIVGDGVRQIVDRRIILSLSDVDHGARIKNVGRRPEDLLCFLDQLERVDARLGLVAGQRDEEREVVEHHGPGDTGHVVSRQQLGIDGGRFVVFLFHVVELGLQHQKRNRVRVLEQPTLDPAFDLAIVFVADLVAPGANHGGGYPQGWLRELDFVIFLQNLHALSDIAMSAQKVGELAYNLLGSRATIIR